MDPIFPAFPPSARQSEAGVNAISTIVNDGFGWFFRRVHLEHDFGIDGYIDVVTDSHGVTGQYLAIQVKSGPSFFKVETPSSYTYYGEMKHLGYYANSPVPVVLAIHNPDSGFVYWTRFAPEATEQTKTGWKTQIPKRQRFTAATKADLLGMLGDPTDATSAVAEYWAFNEVILNHDGVVLYAASRDDVEKGDVAHVGGFFERIRSTETLCRQLQGRVEVSISGYEDDTRELWEIDEARSWFGLADQVVRDWFFFCAALPGHTLQLLACCECDAKHVPPSDGEAVPMLEVDNTKLGHLMDRNWERLNEMTDRLGMSMDENKRISFGIFDVFGIPHPDG